jgi:AcrR family transcriptional regulator
VQLANDLRERKKTATREALQEAAVRLFAEKGYAATSVDEIAAAADVSRSTFFRYFGSKEAVVFSAPDEMGERFLACIEARPAAEGPLKAVEEALVESGRDSDSEAQRTLAIHREGLLGSEPGLKAREAEIMIMWIGRIADALARRDGASTPQTQHRLAASICVAMGREMGEEWLESGQDLESLIRGRFDLLRRLTRG